MDRRGMESFGKQAGREGLQADGGGQEAPNARTHAVGTDHGRHRGSAKSGEEGEPAMKHWWNWRKREKELEKEIRHYLQMAANERGERGASMRDAEAGARREFGNVSLVREVTRDAWGWRWLSDIAEDARYGMRMTLKNPGFSIVAILSLALGIGATTAMFSVVYGVLVNPYPYAHSDRMVHLVLRDAAGNQSFINLNQPQLEQLRQASCVESAAAMEGWNLTTTEGDLPEDVQAVYLTSNSFIHFGVPTLL